MRGIIIPGLSMERGELPQVDGFLNLQNPEVGDGIDAECFSKSSPRQDSLSFARHECQRVSESWTQSTISSRLYETSAGCAGF
jgi:hypothetical protein